MQFEKEVQNKLNIIFKDFTYVDCIAEELLDDKTQISISREDFPVEAILLFTLHKICKFSPIYRWDKMHWGIIFKYKGIVNLISSHKFGMRMYSQKVEGEAKYQVEIINKLKKNIKYIEKDILTKYGEDQILSSNFTIQNNFHKLNNQYLYFRKQAQDLFSEKPFCNKKNADFNEIMNLYLSKKEFDIHAVYNALAMIDSYFSRLEHLLVLSLPFVKSNQSYDMKKFIGEIWSKKYVEVLGLKGEAKRIFDELNTIKERYRNTFAHGGFEKKGHSFHFHLENYGAIPATMSDYKNSVHFRSTPLDKKNFNKFVSYWMILITFLVRILNQFGCFV